jgi:predicted transcriptional regulator
MGSSSTSTNRAVYTLRVERENLDRLSQIAAAEHRTLVQKLRMMIEDEIARHDAPEATAA